MYSFIAISSRSTVDVKTATATLIEEVGATKWEFLSRLKAPRFWDGDTEGAVKDIELLRGITMLERKTADRGILKASAWSKEVFTELRGLSDEDQGGYFVPLTPGIFSNRVKLGDLDEGHTEAKFAFSFGGQGCPLRGPSDYLAEALQTKVFGGCITRLREAIGGETDVDIYISA